MSGHRVQKGVRALDDRLAGASWVRKTLHKAFPNHWSFLLGEVALYSFVVLVVTGIYLIFFFEPSLAETTYTGSYAPLQGVEVSRAYASVLDLSFDVRLGLVMRQTHHWAALIFVGSLAIHLGRVFFTGAFRRPREINWIGRPDPAPPGHGQRLLRLHPARRPALGHRAGHRLRHRGVDPPRRVVADLRVLRRGVPGRRVGPAHVRHARAHPPGRHRRPDRRAHGHPVAPEAHPVPRRGTDRDQRGRLPPVAHLRGQVDLVPPPRLGGHRPAGRAGPDQPGVAVGALRPRRGHHRGPARLLRGLARRCPPPLPGVGDPRLRPHRVAALLARGGDARSCSSACSTPGPSSSGG